MFPRSLRRFSWIGRLVPAGSWGPTALSCVRRGKNASATLCFITFFSPDEAWEVGPEDCSSVLPLAIILAGPGLTPGENFLRVMRVRDGQMKALTSYDAGQCLVS